MTQSLKIPDHLGLNLAAVYEAPGTPGLHPLVILLHGFTGWKEETHISTLATDLASAGIASLRFDAPGSGESDGTWAEHYRLTNYLNDVTDVLEFAKANLAVDPAHIAIWGHSMGGLTALLAAVGHPRDFVAVCGSQPSSGKKVLTAADDKAWQAAGTFSFSNSHFHDVTLPYDYYVDRARYDVVTDIPELKMPLLLIAGSFDKLVPVATVQRIFEAAPQPKRYLEFATGHGYKRDLAALALINAATVDFFRVYLNA